MTMKRRKRRGIGRLLVRPLLGILFIVIGIMSVKTVFFSSHQRKVKAVAAVAIDTGAVRRLSQAIRIPSISTDEGGIDTAAFLRLDTFISTQYPLVDSLLSRLPVATFSQLRYWPGKDKALQPILLMAHLDVVPIEESSVQKWDQPPFSGKIQDGYIWGRGTIDDKSGAFGILEAVEQLLHEKYQPERGIYLAFGHDEEIGGNEGAKRMAQYFKEKNIRFEYVLDEGQLVLEEAMPGLEAPLAMIGIAEKGFTTLSLSINLAEGGHSSMPPTETAIGILSKAINQLQKHPFPARIDGAAAALFDHVGPEMPLVTKALLANRWLTSPLLDIQMSKEPTTNAMIRTTTAPTIIAGGVKDNVLPSTASAQVNFRILPGETAATVAEYVRKTIDDDRVEVRESNAGTSSDPSAVSPTTSLGYQSIDQTIREVFPGVIVAPALVIGATDSRHYKEVSENIYRFLPIQISRAELKGFHGINERISTANYGKAIHFYKQLIYNSDKH